MRFSIVQLFALATLVGHSYAGLYLTIPLGATTNPRGPFDLPCWNVLGTCKKASGGGSPAPVNPVSPSSSAVKPTNCPACNCPKACPDVACPTATCPTPSCPTPECPQPKCSEPTCPEPDCPDLTCVTPQAMEPIKPPSVKERDRQVATCSGFGMVAMYDADCQYMGCGSRSKLYVPK